jgi:hypothetical protein
MRAEFWHEGGASSGVLTSPGIARNHLPEYNPRLPEELQNALRSKKAKSVRGSSVSDVGGFFRPIFFGRTFFGR